MIPLRIAVKNFGAIPEANIDLTNVDLAAIVGPNGVGKSTLFTAAPMFALFGSTKGDGPDTIVRTGETEASVTMEFEHRGDLYRVTRTRSTGGRGKSSLELTKLVTEGGRYAYEPLTGTTIKETEEKIRDLLNLDEETFAASAMILQGKADEFTAKPAGQRKAILAQVLGLEIYDKLQTAARDRAKKINTEMDVLKGNLARLESELAAKDQVIAEKAEIETAIGTAKGELIQARETQKMAQDALANAKGDIESLKEKNNRIALLVNEISGYDAEIPGVKKKLDDAVGILNQESEIVEAYETRQKLQAMLDASKEKRERVTAIGIETGRINSNIAELNASQEQNEARINGARVIINGKLSAIAAKREIDDLTAEIQGLYEKQAAVIEAERKRDALADKVRAAEEQVSILANSHCVAPEKAEKTPCRFLEGAISARNALPEMRETLQRLTEEVQAIGYDDDRRKWIVARTSEVKPLADKLPGIEAQEQVLDTLLANATQYNNSIIEARERSLALRKELETLTAELSGSDDIPERIADLTPLAELKDKLPQAHADKQTAAERLDWISKRVSVLESETSAIKSEIAKLGECFSGGIDELQEAVTRWNNEVYIKETAMNQLHSRLGAVNARIEALTKANQEAALIKEKVLSLHETFSQWAQLVKAFGRDGIPALIIENAVPELERASNEILSRMTGGKHSLRFETQRGLKSKAGIAETLDIIVADWAGERQYETFSGGEQLRINFAIRFALAELLAMRAGSRVEWLTIDEGIGSQDDEHRDLVLEGIRNVADRFKKVLLITHVKEAQGLFPQQIAFSRSGEKVEVDVA